MSENKNKDTFQYTYSAKEQEELQQIRSKYLPKEESKMEKLRRLDAGASQKATLFSLIAGIIGALILGLGMSCCMVWAGPWFVPGIAIGITGIVLICLAYPTYLRVLKKEQARIAPMVLQLTEELMK